MASLSSLQGSAMDDHDVNMDDSPAVGATHLPASSPAVHPLAPQNPTIRPVERPDPQPYRQGVGSGDTAEDSECPFLTGPVSPSADRPAQALPHQLRKGSTSPPTPAPSNEPSKPLNFQSRHPLKASPKTLGAHSPPAPILPHQCKTSTIPTSDWRRVTGTPCRCRQRGPHIEGQNGEALSRAPFSLPPLHLTLIMAHRLDIFLRPYFGSTYDTFKFVEQKGLACPPYPFDWTKPRAPHV